MDSHSGRPSPPVDVLPARVGRYRVIERIGKGAMGAVYAAVDDAIGRNVAVKVLLGDLEEEPDIRDRFLREAKITGQLAHRNVVTMYDMGEEEGRLFLVMELLSGQPLSDHLSTPLGQKVDTRIDLMIQICHGLQAAHAKGVIHRDVKPSNLFVVADGTLKVLDFGVARLASSSLTAAGFLIGTPEYMSPEQAKGLPVDTRSDIFSAGAVFYYMLTGRSPFASRDLRKMLNAILNESPAPLVDQDGPEPLRRIVMKALEKAPDQRYTHVSEMAADLERARRAQDSATQRIILAALDRYKQTLTAIDDRRALGRALNVPDSETTAESAKGRLAARFPHFAAAVASGLPPEPLERAAASDALSALQMSHNAELAALVALKDQHAKAMAAPPVNSASEASSWAARAGAWFRRKGSTGPHGDNG